MECLSYIFIVVKYYRIFIIRADIALGPISVTAEREIDVDFSVPFYDLVGSGQLYTLYVKRKYLNECI